MGCVLDGVRYNNGQSFQPNCKYNCTCVGGAVGCTPLCLRARPPRLWCRRPRRVSVPGRCCEQWVCEDDARRPRKTAPRHTGTSGGCGARARGAGRAAPARGGGGDGGLGRSPAGLLEQSHRVGPGAAAACPPRQCVWPGDLLLSEHKQSPCRVGDLETKAFPSSSANPCPPPPPSQPALLSSVLKGLCCLLSPEHPLLSLIHSCIRSPISPAHLLSLPAGSPLWLLGMCVIKRDRLPLPVFFLWILLHPSVRSLLGLPDSAPVSTSQLTAFSISQTLRSPPCILLARIHPLKEPAESWRLVPPS